MPLRILFVDMNAYFASVEQQDNPRLRGKPVGIVPMMARSTCCLAASYEAKAYGIKTGTPVWQALQLCPSLQLVVARHDRYVEVHNQIVRAVGRCLPIHRVMSIDEMACRLIGEERNPETVRRIGGKIKAEIHAEAGEWIRCSIGIAPNGILAKVASDMQKPNGLTIIESEELPDRLYSLPITDFPGIGPRMGKRFHTHGVFTTQQLCELSVKAQTLIWGSRIHGERWYYILRGEEVHEKATHRRTVGHSHVLPPVLRTDAGARGILVKLIHKAAARLRGIGYWCGRMAVSMRYDSGERWEVSGSIPRCQDTLTLLLAFGEWWSERPVFRLGRPLKVSMVLFDLTPAATTTPSLFESDRQLTTLSHVMDKVNRTFGKNAIHFGTMCGSETTAPTRIAFSNIPEFDPAHE